MKRKGEYADRRRGVSMSCIHDQLMFVCLTLMLCFILIAYISFFWRAECKGGVYFVSVFFIRKVNKLKHILNF